ncbi:hypothetical protein F4678DRAFT_447697 [Xylaria arbuscula]|nr:hypothetical protein F4678DRAFT_447697 [Xylaria arbuscula]
MEGEPGPYTPSGLTVSALLCWGHLTASLNAVKSLDDYSSMKSYPSAPYPALRVSDTLIPLPLSDSAAVSIKKLAEQSISGDESQGATDINRPGAWELGTDQFDILNPTWPSFLNTVMNDVCQQLGITGAVDTKLHKLILCEQNSQIKPLSDLAEREFKVAELLICLPSMHEGGKLRLSLDGQHRTFNIGELPQFTTAALSWPLGATREIVEVVSGHLLVLPYSIVSGPGSNKSKERLDMEVDPVDYALLQCRRQFHDYSTRIYLLDNKYQQTELSLSRLKGRDRAVCESLKRSCSQHGLFLFLSHCGNAVHTGYGGDITKSGPFLTSLNTLDGIEVAVRHSISEDHILNNLRDGSKRTAEFQLPCWGQRQADKGYDTAIVICPILSLFAYLTSFRFTKWSNMVTKMMDDLDRDPDSRTFLDDSLGVLGRILYGGHSSKLRPDVIQWAWKKKYMYFYCNLVRASMQNANNGPDMDAIAKIINNDNLEGEATSSIQWDIYFGKIISRTKSLETFSANLNAIKKTIRPDLRVSFRTWQFFTVAEYGRTLGVEDEEFIRRLVLQSPESWVSQDLIPILKARGEKTLIRNLVAELLINGGTKEPKNGKDIASKILRGMVSKAALELADIQSTGHRRTVANCFLRLLSSCLKADLINLGMELLDASWLAMLALHTGPNDTPLMQNRSSVADFLKLLEHELSHNNIPHRISVKNMFDLFIQRYMHAAVPSYPKKWQSHMLFASDVEAYHEDLSNFERPFKALRTRYVQALLGEGDYRELVMLENVKDSEGSKELAAITVDAGEKRHADETETTGQKMVAKRTRRKI